MKRTDPNFSRLYIDDPLSGSRVVLAEREAHYLNRVLRLKSGHKLIVFNARGRERMAKVASLARHEPRLELGESLAPLPESQLNIILMQSLIKSDAMDLVIQKATELGVFSICAFRSEFSVIKLDDSRRGRRLAHWQRVALSACEQSGRHRPPDIEVQESLTAAIDSLPAEARLIAFDRAATRRFSELPPANSPICLTVGPEGGFSEPELALLRARGFALCGLGQRTLRAETAAITACASAQLLWGDLDSKPEEPSPV